MLQIDADFELPEQELRRLVTKRTRILAKVRRMDAPASVTERWEAVTLRTLFLWQLRKQGRGTQIAELKAILTGERRETGHCDAGETGSTASKRQRTF